jgi:AAA domain-containing protein
MATDDKITHLQTRMDRARSSGANGATRTIVLRPIHEIVAERREPEWLIDDIIEARVLAVLAGPRGTLKSFIATDWAMHIACCGHPCVILSGEGQGLGNRVAAWMNQHREDVDLATLPLSAHELPINLNSLVELDSLRIACSELAAKPKLIVIDTFSKFSAGIDENSNGEVAAYLSGLSMLRDEFGCTVLLVAHSGHGDAKRPRGANALMSNPDCEYIVERTGMTVTVTRERFKDTPSLPPLAYEAKVIELGRLDSRGRPVTSLALVSADAPPSPAKGRGKNQEKVVIALKEWIRAHPEATHLSTFDMRALCKAQGISSQRQAEVVTAFVAIRVLTPSVGGWALHGENL